MNITDIDLKSLEVLKVLLEERNVTRVAKRVGLSQPAVSNALSRLRKFFNDPLLIRTRQGMLPTSKAQALEEPIRKAFQILNNTLQAEAKFDPSTSDHHFVIAATDYAEWVLLPHLAQRMMTEAPNIRIEVMPLKEKIPYKDLENGEADIAIGYFEGPPLSLFQQELFNEDFVCVQRKGFRKSKSLTIKEYAAFKHLIVSPWGGMVGLADAILAKQKLKRSVHLSTTHFLVAPQLVAQSDYVVTLPRRMGVFFSKLLQLEAIELPFELPTLQFKQLWHSRTHHESAYQWLRSEIGKIGQIENALKK